MDHYSPPALLSFQDGLEYSRKKLLNAIQDAADLTLIIGGGNIGDHLILEGTKKLLNGISYREVLREDIKKVSGDTAIILGGGDWRIAYSWAKYLPYVEERFRQTIIFPSSFNLADNAVKNALKNTNATVFAREPESYLQVKDLCMADLVYDCAFFFDFKPYKRTGNGLLTAFRIDKGSQGPEFHKTLMNNNDISHHCNNLDEWLNIIADHETIRTDRAHVMIAAAMLGKQVYYRSYKAFPHKVMGIAELSLKDFPVMCER